MRDCSVLTFSAPNVVPTMRPAPPADADGIVGQSAAVQDVLGQIRRVAPTDASVLITGETGTGKELVAKAIHRQSSRASRPFVAAHLAAVPDALVGSELFGHERGAFTGADRVRIGRFELADRGTLFLDEVGELPCHVQVSLLRVLQEGELERVGGSQMRRVDVRVIAATNRSLDQAMEGGAFRADLYYRLNVVPIHLPPLRGRPADIPALAAVFVERAAARMGRHVDAIEPASLDRLCAFHWPGNIRQLQNVIERSVIAGAGPELSVPESMLTGAGVASVPAFDDRLTPFDDGLTLEDVKRRYVRHVLAVTRGNMSRAAAILAIDRRSLYRIVERYGLTVRSPFPCPCPTAKESTS